MTDRNVQYPSRYKLTLVEGTSDVYELTPVPGEVSAEGTILNKANLLADDTASDLGVPQADPTVDDAFKRISVRLYALAQGGRLITVHLTDYTGAPCPNFKINGMHGPQGETIYTDSSGIAEGVVDSDPATLTTDAFEDLQSVSTQVSAPSGDMTDVYWTIPQSAFINFVRIDASRSVTLSPLCSRLDVNCNGGGGGGGGRGSSHGGTNGGGGGGGHSVIQENVSFTPNTQYPVIVGAGGASSYSNATTVGGTGGTSSAFGVSATGGAGGSDVRNARAAGNGLGGARGYGNNGEQNGGNATEISFFSFTETGYYGGGGGAGAWWEDDHEIYPNGAGGSPNGANGGRSQAGNWQETGTAGMCGGGGGWGFSEWTEGDYDTNNEESSAGGSGCVALRMWHYEVAA